MKDHAQQGGASGDEPRRLAAKSVLTGSCEKVSPSGPVERSGWRTPDVLAAREALAPLS
jgi:hypothetical protein